METQEIEKEFAGFQGRIDNVRLVTSLAKQINDEIMKIADEHEAIGNMGMAGRAERMKRADLARFNKLSDQYTESTLESLPAMMSLFETLQGVLLGAMNLENRKAEITN